MMYSQEKLFTVYIGVGTNQGLRFEQIELAYEMIEKKVGKILHTSSIYETEAWGLTNQNAFLNTVIEVQTALYPFQLLRQLLSIEEEMGRKRVIKWGPRVIDLDIIAFENWQIHSSELTIPHIFMEKRKFVLIPFLEIAPKWYHPNTKSSLEELVKQTSDTSKIVHLQKNKL